MNPYFDLYTNAQRMSNSGFLNLLKFALQYSEEDINQMFYSTSCTHLNYNTLASEFLKNYQYYSMADIQEVLPRLDMSVMVGTDALQGAYFNTQTFTQEGYESYKKSHYLNLKENHRREVAYDLFSNSNQILNIEKFKLVYEYIEKSIVIDREYVLKNTPLCVNLLKTEQFELFNYIAEKNLISINDIVEGEPLYFNLASIRAIDFLLEKNADLSLSGIRGNYLKVLSSNSNGKELIKYLNSKTEIDLEQSLLDFLAQKKSVTEIKELWSKLAKKQGVKKHEVKIKGYNIWQQALIKNHLKFLLLSFESLSVQEQKNIANSYTPKNRVLGGLLLNNRSEVYTRDRFDYGGEKRKALYQKIMSLTDFNTLFTSRDKRTVLLEDILLGGQQFLNCNNTAFSHENFTFSENKEVLKELKDIPIINEYNSHIDSMSARDSLYAKFIDYLHDADQTKLVEGINTRLIDCNNKPFSKETNKLKPLFHYITHYFSSWSKAQLVERIILGFDKNMKSETPRHNKTIANLCSLISSLDISLDKNQLDILMKLIHSKEFVNLGDTKVSELEANYLKKYMDQQLMTPTCNTQKGVHKL